MLALTKYGTALTLTYSVNDILYDGDLGIRVYKRSAGGTETEITPGSPVAVVTYVDGDSAVVKSNTWNCPETVLASTDSIVVRVYARIPSGTGTWTLISSAVFSTEQLGASKLNAATWTVYYTGTFITDEVNIISSIYFHFDGAYNSRIANFTWAVGQYYVIGDGLACAVILA
jgi:hypothetical protein